MISAVETLDCARKVRRHYQLPRGLEAALAAHLPEAQLSVQAFSRFVSGAKDHLTWVAEGFRAAGVAGEHRLVVTFGKISGERPVEAIRGFEDRLARAFAAEVVLVTPAPAGPPEHA